MSGELEGAARSYSTTSGSNVTEKRGTPKTQILDVKTQIQKISNEIARCIQLNLSSITVDENDLSLIKLEEYWTQLQALETEKSDRLYKVIEYLNTVHGLCSVLGLDFLHMITEVHPSLDEAEQFRSVSNETIENLAKTIHALQEEKKKRMQKLQGLVTTMLELWNLMDTPMEEQQMFQNVTRNIAASEHEICAPTALVLDFLDYAEAEVVRLEELKESKMKELVLKKQTELEEICRRTYLLAEANTEIDKAIASMDSGMVECLITNTTVWEKERGRPLLYDGHQKRLWGQLITEQDALFGSKSNPAKPHSAKKASGHRTSTSSVGRGMSLGGAMFQSRSADFLPLKATVAAVSHQGTSQAPRETKRDRLKYNLQNQREDDFTTSSTERSFNTMRSNSHSVVETHYLGQNVALSPSYS